MNFTPTELASRLTSITFNEAIIIAVLGFFIVLLVLTVLAIFVKLLSFVVGSAVKGTKNDKTPAAEKKTATRKPVIQKSDTAGNVILDGVSEQDAAVIMAITSKNTNIPLERLIFKSIKRLEQDPELTGVSEQDAAVIMAITSNKTGIPLEKLDFKFIKLLEE